MKRSLTCFAVLSMVAVLGCVPSLQSFFTESDVTFDKGLVGKWKQDNGQSTWEFSRHAKNGKRKYKLVVEMKEQKQMKRAEFDATLFRLKGQLYLDLFPAGKPFKENVSGFFGLHVLPAHTLAKIERSEGSLRISMMNPEWARKRLESHPDEVNHTKIKDRVVLTASTNDLQAFVDKHKDTPDAFLKPVDLKKD
ncbi:MAG: hypothetical protein ACE5KM_11555 [Planctomycetaceae bacterium]